MAERNYRIAVIGGDGIGPEVVQAGQEVLTALALEDGGFALSFTAMIGAPTIIASMA